MKLRCWPSCSKRTGRAREQALQAYEKIHSDCQNDSSEAEVLLEMEAQAQDTTAPAVAEHLRAQISELQCRRRGNELDLSSCPQGIDP